MTDNWSDVKTNAKKNKNKEEEYYLSSILNNGGCIRCINKSCTNTEKHGTFFPEKLSVFVQNPTYINGMEKFIQNAKLDFDGKKIFYTVCNYVNKKCKNCEEGRIKYIDHNNQKIAICYPLIQPERFKITIGLHIDIKFILKGTKYEVSVIPANIYQPIITEPIIKKQTDMDSEENWPSLSDDKEEISKNENTKDVPREYFRYLTKDSCKEALKEPLKESFKEDSKECSDELLNEPSKEVPKEYFKHLTKNSSKQSFKEPLNESLNESLRDASLKEALLKEALSKESSLKEALSKELMDKDIIIEDLMHQNNFLRKESMSLIQENKLLQQENRKINFMLNNKDKLNEMLKNIENLDAVRQQFVKTNYEQYLLI